MATTGAKQSELPKFAAITIQNGKPDQPDEVEVQPEVGQIHFKNGDARDYRLRFKSSDEELDRDEFDNYDGAGIDILLPAGGTFTIVIKTDDQFYYKVRDINGEDVNPTLERPFGPIRN